LAVFEAVSGAVESVPVSALFYWATITSNGSPVLCYGTIIMSVLSVMLVYCGHTVGWINMPLGTEIGLGRGDPAPPPKGAQQPPHFLAHFFLVQSPISATAELLLWLPYGIGQAIIFLPCGFYLLLSIFFPLPNLSS